MAVSMELPEPFDRFLCFNLMEKDLDVYFLSGMTAGPSDPYKWCNIAVVASFGQHCLRLVIVLVMFCFKNKMIQA